MATVIGKNLARLLREQGKTQVELANFLGIADPSVNAWVSGKTYPRAKYIDGICQFFGITTNELFYEQPLPANILLPQVRSVPILGEICAGDGVLVEQRFDGEFFIDNTIKADYALRVRGDSMIDAGIEDGNLVFIERLSDFREGLIYAVILDGENLATLKRVHIQDNKYILSPCNKDYQPIVADFSDVFILGKVIGYYSSV